MSSRTYSRKQRERFIAKLGREPGPDDPIVFDLDEDKTREDISNAMPVSGIAPALIQRV